MSGRYSKLLVFWAILFTLSAAVIFVNIRVLQQRTEGSFPPGIGPEVPDSGPDEGEQPADSSQTWAIVLAVVTAVASGGGFIVTTIFALRNDRRESALYLLQIKNLKKEIEHKDLEIERMKRERRAPEPPKKKIITPLDS